MKQLSSLFLVPLFCAAFVAPIHAQNIFPSISGETMENKVVSIPEDTEGKYTLVGMAYSEDAERDMRTWYDATYTMFIDKEGINAMVYDVEVKLVLMFTGVNKAATNKAMKNMAEIADEALFPYVVFYKGELKKYKSSLKLEDKNKPYIFVLDKQGKIIHRTSGRYTDKKMDVIGELVEE